jgi:regulator of protease activity HflC (stomatin/prohibitin superfamily)
MTILITLLLLAIAIYYLRSFIKLVTIYDYEQGLKYERGRYQGLVTAGQYWAFKPFVEIRKVDMRPSLVSIPGQELLSADGIPVKISLAARYRVIRPEMAIHDVENYQAALYLELQIALRQIVAGASADTLLAQRGDYGKQLLECAAAKAQILGLELLEAEIKDLMFPGEVKKIFTQVVKARQEGLAALEKARGETAALRNLGNAAKLLEQSPALLQLRLIQAVGEQGGNTLVFGAPPSVTPIPVPPKRKTKKDDESSSD